MPADQNNIRGLIQDTSERLDSLAASVRATTQFAGTTKADAKTFMLISRHSRGLTELARALGISRQAAHKSLKRLIEAQMVSYDYVPGSNRDMIATLTPKGLAARQVGLKIAQQVEQAVEAQIGAADLEVLREILVRLNQGMTESE